MRELWSILLTPGDRLDQDGPSMQHDGRLIRAIDLESIGMASERSGISRSYLYRLIRLGKLDHYVLGGRMLVHRRDVDAIDIRRKAG